MKHNISTIFEIIEFIVCAILFVLCLLYNNRGLQIGTDVALSVFLLHSTISFCITKKNSKNRDKEEENDKEE